MKDKSWDKYVDSPLLIPNPEYDRAGFCVLCHQQIALFDYIENKDLGGKVLSIVRWMGVARDVKFELNDKSTLVVKMCLDCKDNMEPKHVLDIMKSVYKGWKFEIEEQGKWPEFKKNNYLNKYGNKFIKGYKEKNWNKKEIQESLGNKKLRGPLHEIKAKKENEWLP